MKREPDRRHMWRSLEEVGDADALRRAIATHAPRFAPFYDADRREFLKLMSASLALAGLTGCSREPQEAILPYAYAPKGQVAGEPRFYASANVVGGYALGVLVETNMGRPTKIEGNPLHPASLGSTDVFAQAAVLDLWDPDRTQAVTRRGTPSTWDAFAADLQSRLRALARKQGDGLRILTQTVTSPTLARQMQALLARYPKARWHAYEPVNRDNADAGSRLAFGDALDTLHHFDRAAVVLSLDADFLGSGPARVRDARDFVDGHATHGRTQASNRLYAVTTTPSLTSAYADHHVAVQASAVEAVARTIARQVGVDVEAPQLAVLPQGWLAACAKDLAAHRGASLVVAGAAQPPVVHAIAHAMNATLGNAGKTMAYIDRVAASPQDEGQSLAALARDMAAGVVDTLLVIGGNPVYESPRDIAFAEALRHVPASIHLGLYDDETAARCTWHLPATHSLEAWSDARAFDGSVTILQPTIAPLYDGRSAHELLSMLVDGVARRGYDVVRETWQSTFATIDFEAAWNKALADGIVANSAYAERTASVRTSALAANGPRAVASPNAGQVEVMFASDPSVYDGRYANNPWLQELPRPLTKITWDNAALVAPALAARLGLGNDDVVVLRHGDARIEAPVWAVPGHPDNAVTLALGYGRTRAGRVGDGHGVDAYRLRTSKSPWFLPGVALERTARRQKLATTQHHHAMEGRDLVRVATLAAFRRDASAVGGGEPERAEPTLYDPFVYDGYRWAMSVDLGACIGCNACTIACQAENNIPTVGKGEVFRGREMHWIRVDRYYDGAIDAPRTHFQPVPCMQCERAPCELVCPVEASVHDHQGINVQVYNRCVGTRFCSNNCPYQVRRFNFLQYSDWTTESLKAQRNPEVTVRMRGIMEKCNYCLQRIENGRITADKENRRVRDGEVVTACQAVCPTRAITFGDLADPASAVNARKASPLDYTLLRELNTKPRTTYLAKLRNPNPDLGET
jgi:molybdopterin-containing oxidoreductase family iron-sulfur binding subunit